MPISCQEQKSVFLIYFKLLVEKQGHWVLVWGANPDLIRVLAFWLGCEK